MVVSTEYDHILSSLTQANAVKFRSGELNRILLNFVQDQLGQISIETDLIEFGQIFYKVTPTQSNTTKFGLVGLNF